MSVISEKQQRVAAWDDAEFFGPHTERRMWSVGVQELISATDTREPVWQVVSLLSVNCRTRSQAIREASEVLRGWLDTLAAQVTE